MQYVIYPDLLFLENFICNLLCLTFFKRLFFPAANWKRILFAGFVTAFCNTLISILFFRCILILKLGVLMPASGAMICSCMQIRDQRRIFYLIYQMTLWTLVLGGILQSQNQKIFASMGILMVVFGILEKVMKKYRRQNECMKEITLYLDGHCCHVKGFADTGNQLMDPFSKNPVSVLTKDVWEILSKDSENVGEYLIPYKTVGNPEGLIRVVHIDYMVIVDGNRSRVINRPVLAITEQPFMGTFHYSILLHSDFC